MGKIKEGEEGSSTWMKTKHLHLSVIRGEDDGDHKREPY